MTRFALVTGAAGGLARGVALGLARAGYRIAFTFRPGGTPPDATLALVRPYDAGALAIPSDAASEVDAARVVAIAADRGPIEVLVHGVGPIVVKTFAKSTPADYRAMIEGNLTSAVSYAFAVLPSMRERRFGRLIYFGMNGSHTALPARGMSLYGPAKAAVVTFARALALEEGKHGITVNAIEPGDIRDKKADRAAARLKTANNPSGHAGSWEDIAAAVAFLVSEDAGFISGQCLGVNGGLVDAHEGLNS